MNELVAEDLSTSNNLASELSRARSASVSRSKARRPPGRRRSWRSSRSWACRSPTWRWWTARGWTRAIAPRARSSPRRSASARSPQFATLWSGLSVAGQSGTLVDQIGGELTGKVRGKTGTLSNASGLVGLVEVSRQLRFAFVANAAMSEPAAIALRGRIVAIIATFPDAPPADALVPGPDAAAQP